MTEAIAAWWIIVFFGSLFGLVWQAAKKERKRIEERKVLEKIAMRYKKKELK